MGLFSREITAEDILKRLAEMSDEERGMVRKWLGESAEEEVSKEDEEAAKAFANAEAAAEAETESEAEGEEAEAGAETEAEEATDGAEAAAGPEEAAEEAVEKAAEATEEAEAPKAPETPAEAEGSEGGTSLDVILDRLNAMEETIAALCARLAAKEDGEKAEAEKEEKKSFGLGLGGTVTEDAPDTVERLKNKYFNI